MTTLFNMWHLTCDTWRGGGTFSQNISSQALSVWDWQCIEDSEQKDHLMNEWMIYLIIYKVVYRTALSALGPLIIVVVIHTNERGYMLVTLRLNLQILLQSVANNFSDEQIQIWILFAKGIFYKYEYEYYSWHIVWKIWIRIIFFKNIHKYIWVFKYIKIFYNNHTSSSCYLPVWKMWIKYQNLFVTFHISNQVEYLQKNS